MGLNDILFIIFVIGIILMIKIEIFDNLFKDLKDLKKRK